MNKNEYRESCSIARWIYDNFYSEKEGCVAFELCDSTAGVLSQIDNMSVGILEDLTTITKQRDQLVDTIAEQEKVISELEKALRNLVDEVNDTASTDAYIDCVIHSPAMKLAEQLLTARHKQSKGE